MPDFGPHASFIIAAYAVTFLTVAALVMLILADDRHQQSLLDNLERKGFRRRSAPAGKLPRGNGEKKS
jgi:heme exporter protein D